MLRCQSTSVTTTLKSAAPPPARDLNLLAGGSCPLEPCPGLPDQRRDGGGYELSAVPLAAAHVQQNDEQRKGGEASGSGAVLQRCGGGGPLKLLMSRLFFGKGRRQAHEGSDFLKVLPLLLMFSLRPLRQMEKHLVHAFDVFQSRLGQDHTFVSSVLLCSVCSLSRSPGRR